MIMTRQIQAMFDEVQNVEYNTLRGHQLSNSLYCIVSQAKFQEFPGTRAEHSKTRGLETEILDKWKHILG